MVFSSITFILYFLPVLLLVYYAVDRNYKNVTLLLFSVFFYSWGAPKFIFAILGTTLIDFYLVKWMDQTQKKQHRIGLLCASVCLNIGLLFYFKYANFFIENVNVCLTAFGIKHIGWTKLILPIGISFYTFETITYVVDVYRKVHKPLRNFWDYQLYIILFPKLIAGPIVRYHDLAGQIQDRTANETLDNKLIGFYRFAMGLAKKVLLANPMGFHADAVFSMDYASLDPITAWMGILAYTFQIYFDFSGYSDMAIGIAQMLGFKFPENFNNPYTSGSITEFWKRWHISLGNWMRNYLYIPLGGNRVSSKRLYLNLWLVFLISGLWHGASWSFVIWGAYHGLFLVLERSFLGRIYEKMGRFLPTIITFFIVVIGWVFFRVEAVSDALVYITQLFDFNGIKAPSFDLEFCTYFILATFFAFFSYFKIGQLLQNAFYTPSYSLKKHLTVFLLCSILMVLSIASISAFNFNPFIYFRF